MIYDCFTFFNELDILEIRLHTLNDVVDKFVLVESPVTFHGKNKPLFYSENQARFARFRCKIIHIVSSLPTQQVGSSDKIYFFEHHQRDAIMLGLADCRPDDLVLVSDVDEIPNPEKIPVWSDVPGVKVFEQQMMYYFLNMRNWKRTIWRGTRMGRFADLLDPAQDVPTNLARYVTLKGLPSYFRFCDGPHVRDGGWHFSYCGGAEAIMKKMNAIADTQEPRYSAIVANADAAGIRRAVVRGQDIYGRRNHFYVVVGLKKLPRHVQENTDKYAHLVVLQNGKERLMAAIWFFINIALYLQAKTLRVLKKIIAWTRRTSGAAA
ncbi:MAG: hypothetical protein FWG17_00830 [Desulfovibrionaceae bacterium]|nr:hypothetical protein [Desulfovibrionaceae bacterium]